MISEIDAWRRGGVVLQMEREETHNSSELTLENSEECPVQIELLSTPLCNLEPSPTTLQNTHSSMTVSLPIVVVSSVVEFVVLLIVFLSVSLLFAQLKAKRRKQ